MFEYRHASSGEILGIYLKCKCFCSVHAAKVIVCLSGCKCLLYLYGLSGCILQGACILNDGVPVFILCLVLQVYGSGQFILCLRAEVFIRDCIRNGCILIRVGQVFHIPGCLCANLREMDGL